MEQLKAKLAELWSTLGGDLGLLASRVIEVLLVAAVAAVLARRVRRRALRLGQSGRLDATHATLLANVSTVAVYALAAVFSYSVLGGSVAVSATLLGAATVALSLALQDVLRSIVAGFYLLAERPFALGERISVKDADGSVEAINLRTTTLAGADGARFHVPNSTLFGEIVTNRASRDGEPMLVTVSNLAAGNADLAGEISRAIASAPGVRSPVRIHRYALEGDELSFTAYVVLDSGRNAGSAVIERLRQRFGGANVVIERRTK